MVFSWLAAPEVIDIVTSGAANDHKFYQNDYISTFQFQCMWNGDVLVIPESEHQQPAKFQCEWQLWNANTYIDDLGQDCSNSSALALELLWYCAKS